MKKDLELLLDCPVCSSKYEKNSVRIVSGKENSLLVHLSCGQCQSNSLALVSKSLAGGAMVSMGMLTDLSFDEVDRLLSQAPITTDEVLDIHQHLKISRV